MRSRAPRRARTGPRSLRGARAARGQIGGTQAKRGAIGLNPSRFWLHASNLMSLGRADEVARESWRQALEFPEKSRVLKGQSWCPGRITGILVGGNLTVLVNSLALGTLSFPDNCILALEDVSESSYRVDRLLSALLNSGVADKIAAVALGQFIGCDPGKHEVDVSWVLRDQVTHLGVPVVSDLPFGHGTINAPLPFGLPASLDATIGTLRLGKPN